MPSGNKILSCNIRNARIEAEITQREAAEQLGITQLHYGRLERGERRASIEQVDKIAQMLGVSPYDLLNGCFERLPKPAFDSPEVYGLLERLAPLFRACTPEERELCFDICERIARGK